MTFITSVNNTDCQSATKTKRKSLSRNVRTTFFWRSQNIHASARGNRRETKTNLGIRIRIEWFRFPYWVILITSCIPIIEQQSAAVVVARRADMNCGNAQKNIKIWSKIPPLIACIDRRAHQMMAHKKRTSPTIHIQIALDYAIYTPRAFVYLIRMRPNAIEKEQFSERRIALKSMNERSNMPLLFCFFHFGCDGGATRSLYFIVFCSENLHEIQIGFEYVHLRHVYMHNRQLVTQHRVLKENEIEWNERMI